MELLQKHVKYHLFAIGGPTEPIDETFNHLCYGPGGQCSNNVTNESMSESDSSCRVNRFSLNRKVAICGVVVEATA